MHTPRSFTQSLVVIVALFTAACRAAPAPGDTPPPDAAAAAKSGEAAPAVSPATSHAASPAAGTASAAGAPASRASGPGAWFVETGCAKCHTVSVYGVTAETQIGPDLSIAVEDVQARFGMPLEEFLETPAGTMAIVLSTQIPLTPDQKKVAIAKLKDAFAEYQRQQAAGRAAGGASPSGH